jgi:putative transposase
MRLDWRRQTVAALSAGSPSLGEGAPSSAALPEQIVVDNGTEFTSRAMDQWVYEHKLKLGFIRPGRPMENGCDNRYGKFRENARMPGGALVPDSGRYAERLSKNRGSNTQVRPHSSRGSRTPVQDTIG